MQISGKHFASSSAPTPPRRLPRLPVLLEPRRSASCQAWKAGTVRQAKPNSVEGQCIGRRHSESELSLVHHDAQHVLAPVLSLDKNWSLLQVCCKGKANTFPTPHTRFAAEVSLSPNAFNESMQKPWTLNPNIYPIII